MVSIQISIVLIQIINKENDRSGVFLFLPESLFIFRDIRCLSIDTYELCVANPVEVSHEEI